MLVPRKCFVNVYPYTFAGFYSIYFLIAHHNIWRNNRQTDTDRKTETKTGTGTWTGTETETERQGIWV